MGISILTLNGMESAYQMIYNKSIFDGIQLPAGINLQTLVERIFIRCGEFSVMHTDPDYFKWQTDNFFKVHYNTFQKWYDALNIAYNPLENYDRYEQYAGNGNSSSQASSTGSGTTSETSSGTNGNTTTNTVAAFNSSSYENHDKSVSSGTDSNTASGTSSSTDSSSGSGTYADTHSSRIHGNIGVTTSQQMLQAEWDISLLNIFTSIADLYCDEFCIKVY